jgi:signal transduction histidine kinase
MMNLFLNAIDAMSSVGCRARVLEVHSAIADDSGTLHISVKDTGSGIDVNAAERLFEPLFSTKKGGMGMGLSICRSIVEAHGGRIWSTSRQPHGTAFHVSLPPASARCRA